MNITYLRSFRIGKDPDFAIFDFAISFIIMFLIGLYFGRARQFLAATIPLSVAAHLAFGQMTPLTKMTIEPGFYHVKFIMAALVLLSIT